jgi:lantibiotic modifying enzyme
MCMLDLAEKESPGNARKKWDSRYFALWIILVAAFNLLRACFQDDLINEELQIPLSHSHMSELFLLNRLTRNRLSTQGKRRRKLLSIITI